MAELIFGSRKLCTERPAFVMGIVNATPDSFYDKSRGGYQRAMELIEQGVDILDIGGESTRPGFTEVPVQEEIDRVVPLIEKIREKSSVPISVDTRKALVYKYAYEAGADVLNDVSSMDDDSLMLETFAATEGGIILMHRWPESETEGADRNPVDIIETQSKFFSAKITALLNKGVKAEKIIVDPGLGFGKNFEESVELIKNCGKIMEGKYPVLMALSRKRCIGQMTGQPVENRLTGTVSADIFSVLYGASIVRVHDVAETIDSLNVMKYLIK